MRKRRKPVFNKEEGFATVPTNKKTLKMLHEIQELRIQDLKGNLIMTFWKGEKHQ